MRLPQNAPGCKGDPPSQAADSVATWIVLWRGYERGGQSLCDVGLGRLGWCGVIDLGAPLMRVLAGGRIGTWRMVQVGKTRELLYSGPEPNTL